MTDQPTILHGPRLSQFKVPLGEKRRPCTWTLSARFQARQVDAIEAMARKKDCRPGDIIRTAVLDFLNKFSPAEVADNGPLLTAHQTAREAQINLGLLPTSNSRRNRAEPNRSPPSDNLNSTSLSTDHQNNQNTQIQTPTQLSPKTQRGGMKDTLNRL